MNELIPLQTPILDDGELINAQTIFSSMTTSQTLTELVIRFILNLASCLILARCLYYPKSKRSDYLFTFVAFSSAVLLLLNVMGNVEIGIGLTLGLFAIFGILRYRTEMVPIREMTYLFLVIAIAAINGLSTVFSQGITDNGDTGYAIDLGSIGITLITNIVIICLVAFLEAKVKQSSKLILYDKIELVNPSKRAELIEDLKSRTGLDIKDVEIGNLDYLKDSAVIRIVYTPKTGELFSSLHSGK